MYNMQEEGATWQPPMGVAFNLKDTNVEMFPVISAWNMKISVNFGEKDFHYTSRPESGCYKKLFEI